MRTDNDARPRSRKWFISLIILYSAAAVVGALLSSNAHSDKSKILAQKSGAVTLTLRELVSLVKKEKLVAYLVAPSTEVDNAKVKTVTGNTFCFKHADRCGGTSKSWVRLITA